MNYSSRYSLLFALWLGLSACDDQDKDVVKPIYENFPQIVLLADEGDGGLEDEDRLRFVITLADRIDPEGEELAGKVIPLTADVTVRFAVTDYQGSANLSDYLKGWKAFYQIDDCTTSEDQNMDLNLTFDPASGEGSVRFPAGVEEIEIEFETDEALFDDEAFNPDARGLTIGLTGLDANGQNVVVNTDNPFEYRVLDDEGIYGEWELDPEDATQFAQFRTLFGLINDDIADLRADEVEEMTVEFAYGEVKAVVVLKETELVEECGEAEEANQEIEVDAELEEVSDDAREGNVAFGEALEQADGSEKEFAYAGSFAIVDGKLQLTLTGEYDDATTEGTLLLEK